MVWEVLLCGCKSALGVSVFGGWVRGMGRVCFAVLKPGLCSISERKRSCTYPWSGLGISGTGSCRIHTLRRYF